MELSRNDYGYCALCRTWASPMPEKQQVGVCKCVVAALAEMAPDPATRPGRHFRCTRHDQVVVWDGLTWKWSNQADDIGEFPRLAG
ncbi:hypothetical protein DMB38_20410 [Streptomyces sp. WAC 06738]|nr:hypothetical protein DMB38_20410 [Streptomyces sp. WAC 06738]